MRSYAEDLVILLLQTGIVLAKGVEILTSRNDIGDEPLGDYELDEGVVRPPVGQIVVGSLVGITGLVDKLSGLYADLSALTWVADMA